MPPGEVVSTVKAATRVAEDIGGQRWVGKAQSHAGGRGKAGGVRLANSVEELRRLTDKMLGTTLATTHTDPSGQIGQRVLIERACKIERELYLGLVIDRATQRIVVIASADGGMNIEKVAEEHPERIHKEVVDPATGLLDFQCRKVATAIGLQSRMSPFVRILTAFYR